MSDDKKPGLIGRWFGGKAGAPDTRESSPAPAEPGSRSPAPDLRRISKGCRRIQDEALRERCLADGDAFFIKSVRYGKQKFGIVHMPPWEGVISPELAWALRSFVETAPAR